MEPRSKAKEKTKSLPFWLASVACGQYLAAVAFGLSAYRTFKAPLGFALIVAALTMISCSPAATCNLWLASSVHPSSQPNVHNDRSADKKDAKNNFHNENSTSIHDTDFASLSAFDKGWLAIHLLAFGAIVIAVATQLSPPMAGAMRRQRSQSAPRAVRSMLPLTFFELVTVVSFMLPIWLQRIGHPWSSKEHTCNAVFTLALTFAEALFLAIATHNTSNATGGLVLVRLQTTVASWAFFLCGVYDVLLMLKIKPNASSSDTADVEKEGGR